MSIMYDGLGTKIFVIVVSIVFALVYNHFETADFPFNDLHLKGISVEQRFAPHNCVMSHDWTHERCEIYVPYDQDCNIHLRIYSPRSNYSKPNSPRKFPTVIVSPPYGAHKDFDPIDKYARSFVLSEVVTVALDYRRTGGSYCDSELLKRAPREEIRPLEQVDDIVFITRHILANKMNFKEFKIDLTKIGLFGIGHSGGLMLSAADKIGTFRGANISSIVCLSPFISGKDHFWRNYDHRGFIPTLRAVSIALLDIIFSKSAFTPSKPMSIKLVGDKSETSHFLFSEADKAVFNDTNSPPPPISIQSSESSVGDRYLGDGRNLAPAKGLLYLAFYNPISIVKDISAPILFVSAGQDETRFPAAMIRTAFNQAFRGRSMELNVTHYELFSGKLFDYTSKSILNYFMEHFKVI